MIENIGELANWVTRLGQIDWQSPPLADYNEIAHNRWRSG